MKDTIRLLLTGLAYTVLGAMGLALAIPPGYASPVFPAAGFAAAAALCLGNRVLAGVWLGSFSLNFGVAALHGQGDYRQATVSAVLGLGAMSQTYLAKTLVECWQSDTWRHLETEREIALFMGITGPIACVTSATIGITTLWASGIVSPPNVLFSWVNWWIGDSLGVMIFAPLTMTFLMGKSSAWGKQSSWTILPLLLTVAAAVAVFVSMSKIEHFDVKDQVKEYGQRIAMTLDRRFVAHQEAISALSRLIEVSPDMTFKQFEDFTRITLENNRDIFVLGYNPIVQAANRTEFEKSMVFRSPVPGFRITQLDAGGHLAAAASQPLYVVVGFIAPLQGNLPAIGYDIYSESVRRAAIKKAMESGETVVTAPIQLVQENRKSVGALILDPSYDITRGASPEKKPRITSFAVGVIKLNEMIEIATKEVSKANLLFRLTDTTVGGERKEIYSSDGTMQSPASPFAWQSQLKMADRQWTLTVGPTPAYLEQHRSWLAWAMGIISLMFTVLLYFMMLTMTGRNSLIQRKVEEQTAELTLTKKELEVMNRSLRERVDESIADLRKKDQVLIVQGRQAAMGEMIGAIAHQWRQPLNSLGLIIQNLKDAHAYGELDTTYLERTVEKSMRLLQHMSKTIDDFRNFFNPHKERAFFAPLDAVGRVLTLFSAQLAANEIEIQEVCSKNGKTFALVDDIAHCSNPSINGFENEFEHVIMNLLNNSREAILEKRTSDHGGQKEKGQIKIRFDCSDDKIQLELSDNGVGVPEEALDRIFEPYFTTKNPAKGTGLGLYMSKVIVEEHLHGSLLAANRPEGGAAFTIIVPLAMEGEANG